MTAKCALFDDVENEVIVCAAGRNCPGNERKIRYMLIYGKLNLIELGDFGFFTTY